MPVTKENVEKVFTYQAPAMAETVAKYAAINLAARNLAEVILKECPSCADQQAALRLVREARMTANAAVALDGLV